MKKPIFQIIVFSLLAALLGICLLIVFVDAFTNVLGLTFYEEYFLYYFLVFILLIIEIYSLVKRKKWGNYLGFILILFLFIHAIYNLLSVNGPVVDINTILSLTLLKIWYYLWLIENIMLVAIMPLLFYSQIIDYQLNKKN